MLDYLDKFALRIGIALETLLALGIGFGVALVMWGIYAAFFRPDPAIARLAAIGGARRQERLERALLRAPDKTPGGLMKAFLPGEKEKRSALRRKLAQAGMGGENALRNYTLVRVLLATGLPLLFLMLVIAARTPGIALPPAIGERLANLSGLAIYQLLTVLLAIGYFLPALWLSQRVTERQLRIEEGFPNALDLLQISIEAGLGFDAAMTRVGNELMHSSRDIALEFLTVQHQVQAGRMRDAALRDMAERIGLETVQSFANVVQQSMQFGTPMGQAMTTYSDELRETREMRAQEMANKLPVKMSMVLASLMLPALIILTVGPTFIRYIRQF